MFHRLKPRWRREQHTPGAPFPCTEKGLNLYFWAVLLLSLCSVGHVFLCSLCGPFTGKGVEEQKLDSISEAFPRQCTDEAGFT